MDINWSNLKFERQTLNFNLFEDSNFIFCDHFHPEDQFMFAKYKGKSNNC